MKRPDVRRIFDKIRNLCRIRFVLERVMLWKIMKGDVSASPPVYEVETAILFLSPEETATPPFIPEV